MRKGGYPLPSITLKNIRSINFYWEFHHQWISLRQNYTGCSVDDALITKFIFSKKRCANALTTRVVNVDKLISIRSDVVR